MHSFKHCETVRVVNETKTKDRQTIAENKSRTIQKAEELQEQLNSEQVKEDVTGHKHKQCSTAQIFSGPDSSCTNLDLETAPADMTTDQSILIGSNGGEAPAAMPSPVTRVR
jgi:hypothetical protein